MKPNAELRNLLKENGIFLWQVARKLDVHEQTLYNWLRYEPLPEKHREMIFSAIEAIKQDGDCHV